MKTRPAPSGLQLMFTAPQALLPFLIGSLTLGIMANAAFQLLMKLLGAVSWLGTEYARLAAVLLGGSLILWLAQMILSRFFNRVRSAPPLLGKQAPEKRKGLILLVSRKDPAWEAIQYHWPVLEECWLLCSDQSQSTAEELRDTLRKAGKRSELKMVRDVYDPLEFRDIVDAIYRRPPVGWSEADIILDFTGMTALGSVGSVLACMSEQRPIQFTPAVYGQDLAAEAALAPVEIVLHWGILGAQPAPGSAVGASADAPRHSDSLTGEHRDTAKHSPKTRRK